jgi:hypothetical protein
MAARDVARGTPETAGAVIFLIVVLTVRGARGKPTAG